MSRYQAIHELDQKITDLVKSEQFSAEEFLALVDNRRTLVENALSDIRQQPSLAQSPEWLTLVAQTKTIVEMMEDETSALAQTLRKYRQGAKSVQQYKRFI
ncbi:flagellar protein FliT [Vibrio sp. FNV 38]|nr:flagellar protein FliT [Vibrio sp. FNV 38]